MTEIEFINLCRKTISEYVLEHVDATDNAKLSADDVYVVWYCKSLQNHKALLSTPLPDGMYYELTFNGNKSELYFDAYKKFENKCIFIAKEVE